MVQKGFSSRGYLPPVSLLYSTLDLSPKRDASPTDLTEPSGGVTILHYDSIQDKLFVKISMHKLDDITFLVDESLLFYHDQNSYRSYMQFQGELKTAEISHDRESYSVFFKPRRVDEAERIPIRRPTPPPTPQPRQPPRSGQPPPEDW